MPKAQTGTTIYLTAEEKKIFSAFPAALTQGYTVADEKLTFEDTDAKREIRMRNLKIESPSLKKTLESAKKEQNTEKILSLAQGLDLSGASENDVLELYYAMGPAAFTQIISVAISRPVKDAADLQALVALFLIRHELLVAMNLPPKY